MKNRRLAAVLVVSGMALGTAAGIPAPDAQAPQANVGYMAVSYFTDIGALTNAGAGAGAAAGSLAAVWLGAKIGGAVGAAVGGPVGVVVGAGLGAA